MERPSCRLLGSGESRRCVQLGSGADHISALPDDLLLLVLARLECAAAAGRTSVLARRWRGLWTSLPSLAFRGVAFHSLKKALNALARDNAVVSSFDISVADEPHTSRGVSSVLGAAAWFLPEELAFAVPTGVGTVHHPVELPFLDWATSISLSMGKHPVELRVQPAPPAGCGDGECLFPALTKLFLSGYYAADGLAALVAHCPRLLVLSYAVHCIWPCSRTYAITVHSAKLRELVVEECELVHRVDVAAPMLEQLAMSFFPRDYLTVSVVAPMAEEVLWRCRYGYHGSSWHTAFGDWVLEAVTLMTWPSTETRSAPSLLRIDLSTGHSYFDYFEELPDDYLEQEVEKHLQLQVAADLSDFDLEVHLTAEDHVYGAIVVYLMGMHRVCPAARSLKVVLLTPEEDVKGCDEGCSCEPNDWRSKTVTLAKLEEVEIDGFRGEDHEFDFLELVFRCTPMLKRVTVKQSNEVASSNEAKIHHAFRPHPSVEFQVLSS